MKRIFKSSSAEINKVIENQGIFEAIRIGERNVRGFAGIRTAEDHLLIIPSEKYGGTIIRYYTLNEYGEGSSEWGFDFSYLVKDGIIYEIKDTIYLNEEIDWEDGTPINPEHADHGDNPRDWGSLWHAMGVYIEAFPKEAH